jgi:aryl-alcohol dehydrogenase-like predicted oxidoreductase
MQMRNLGAAGPRVSALGLGCMAMSGVYGPTDRAKASPRFMLPSRPGITLLDNGDFCGMGHNKISAAA